MPAAHQHEGVDGSPVLSASNLVVGLSSTVSARQSDNSEVPEPSGLVPVGSSPGGLRVHLLSGLFTSPFSFGAESPKVGESLGQCPLVLSVHFDEVGSQ